MDQQQLLSLYRFLVQARYIDHVEKELTNRGEAFFHLSGAGHEAMAALAPHLDPELAEFYRSLLKSESRHFLDYLRLAVALSSSQEVDKRVPVFCELEAELIQSPDTEFRFHSGVPA